MMLAPSRDRWSLDRRTEAASTGIEVWSQIPLCLVAENRLEYAAGLAGPKLAKKYGVGSTRTIYLILEKYRRERTWS